MRQLGDCRQSRSCSPSWPCSGLPMWSIAAGPDVSFRKQDSAAAAALGLAVSSAGPDLHCGIHRESTVALYEYPYGSFFFIHFHCISAARASGCEDSVVVVKGNSPVATRGPRGGRWTGSWMARCRIGDGVIIPITRTRYLEARTPLVCWRMSSGCSSSAILPPSSLAATLRSPMPTRYQQLPAAASSFQGSSPVSYLPRTGAYQLHQVPSDIRRMRCCGQADRHL